MKFKLNRIASDLFVTFYVMATLFFRFQLENQLNGSFLVSIALGGFALLFLWALHKIGFIQPSWFGLYKER